MSDKHAPDCARDIDYRIPCNCSPEAMRARIRELEETLRRVLASARPNDTYHPTMSAEWRNAQNVLEGKS